MSGCNEESESKKELTFNELPQAIGELIKRVARIEQLLTEENKTDKQENQLMSLTEAIAFLRLTKSTIYSKVCRGEIPAFKTGRRLYFDQNELTEWIRSSRKRTNEAIREDADRYLHSSKLMPAPKRRAFRR